MSFNSVKTLGRHHLHPYGMAHFDKSPAITALNVGQISAPSIDAPSGVIIHCAQLQPTDRPIEDRYSVHFDTDQNRLILGVYDGHGGSETADHISRILPQRLLVDKPNNASGVFENVDEEMLDAFKRDWSIFHKKSANWVQNAHLILSGSTALVIDINLLNRVATWASAGDCRLVVGSLEGSRGGVALFETKDFNAGTEEERTRISDEHPNEELIFVGERLFGRLRSTRGFGDGYYKLPKRVRGIEQHRRYINAISRVERPGKIPMKDAYAALFYGYKTPPYIAARPQVGSHPVESTDIVILATDGLWDLISSEDALNAVIAGVKTNSNNLASHLIQEVQNKHSPGDDITVMVFAFTS